ncbi:MAG: CpaF family protein [Lachnospiraceae bacterium]|nr:CpaF family protein [Lachnospiraceae bacterium]MBQ9642501.1 CpaF family protein [Lachnospiraceae bacterium]
MRRSYEEIRETVHERILSGIDYSIELADEEILRLIDEETMRCAGEEQLTLSQMRTLRQEVFYSIRKLDVLQELVDDPGITEIMINGTENIFIERNGRTTRYGQHFTSRQKLEDVIQTIVSSCNRVVNEASPIVDARLENGARVNVVMAPVALNGPIVTIRRFPDKPIGMDDLIRFGSLSTEIADFLKKLVAAGYNIFISGGTGSGKTTFLNALSDFIPKTERIITIEDNAELQILHIPNLVRLEARNANIEGCVPISIRDLIRSSLRMRPDRIIVGEVRGAEAIDMIQAMNTGHDGSMSTGHANSASDMISRLETMILMGMELPMPAIRGQLASGIDLIIHLGRLRDGSRKLLEIAEVRGMEEGRVKLCSLCCYEETGEKNGKVLGTWRFQETLRNKEKLLRAGIAL